MEGNVVISKPGESPQSTKDGVTVAKNISLEDPTEELGVQMLKQAALKQRIKQEMVQLLLHY